MKSVWPEEVSDENDRKKTEEKQCRRKRGRIHQRNPNLSLKSPSSNLSRLRPQPSYRMIGYIRKHGIYHVCAYNLTFFMRVVASGGSGASLDLSNSDSDLCVEFFRVSFGIVFPSLSSAISFLFRFFPRRTNARKTMIASERAQFLAEGLQA